MIGLRNNMKKKDVCFYLLGLQDACLSSLTQTLKNKSVQGRQNMEDGTRRESHCSVS